MPTMAIKAGGVQIGGGAPVSIQSMTNTDTRDAEATVAQISALVQAGCEIARVSVYDEQCAKSVRAIKDRISIPLVADIHFDYQLAIASVENGIDKLRINPGNIGGEQKVKRLADCAKAHGVPIRIGVNAGSLEKELLVRFGRPTPEAMVESALSHVCMLERAGFTDIVLSLKASNVRDTVDAYRLIHKRVMYPLHVGVTEAGLGEDALVKSAIGIGALLLDGIGDTMRVSITGDPVEEVYAAKKILHAIGLRCEGAQIISCPTCGRCNEDLAYWASMVREKLPRDGKPIRVAVMGCAVNGPGEAREADIGIAFGKGNGVVFKRGEKIASGSAEDMVALLISEAHSFI